MPTRESTPRSVVQFYKLMCCSIPFDNAIHNVWCEEPNCVSVSNTPSSDRCVNW